jgi:hypothetical protein
MCIYAANKRQFLFVRCKKKTETANFRLFTANCRLFTANGNGKQKFVFIGWQMINGN